MTEIKTKKHLSNLLGKRIIAVGSVRGVNTADERILSITHIDFDDGTRVRPHVEETETSEYMISLHIERQR